MIEGHYRGQGMAFSVTRRGDELAMDVPEAPAGVEPRLTETEGGWVIRGGPFSGVSVRPDGDGLVMADLFPMERVVDPPSLEPGHGLLAPEPPPDDPIFSDLWETAQQLDGAALDLDGVPPHRFVQWLLSRDIVIFHGSNDRTIDEFLPRRTSLELHDVGGRGNLGAIYGTHDGLWSMFFATVDRSALRGSISNGVARYDAPDGRTVDVYHFSVSSESLPERPFTAGALYLLPRDTFERIPFFPGGPPSPEWASHEPVRPICRILLEPEDFPFLDDIGGHDDGPLLELEELTNDVFDAATSAERIDGGFRFTTTADPGAVARWAELGSSFFPDMQRTVESDETGSAVTMTGPPALLHVMEGRLGDLID